MHINLGELGSIKMDPQRSIYPHGARKKAVGQFHVGLHTSIYRFYIDFVHLDLSISHHAARGAVRPKITAFVICLRSSIF